MAKVFKYKQVIVVRADLEMSPGKLATQVAHGAVIAFERARKEHREWAEAWLREGQKKAVVKVLGDEGLRELRERAKELELPSELIQDAELTELPPGTTTVLAVGPAPAELVDKVTSVLSLF